MGIPTLLRELSSSERAGMLSNMSWLFGIAGAAGLVRVACPHCGHQQVRGRIGRKAVYVCRNCHRMFSRSEGEREVDGRPPNLEPRM